SSHAAGEGSRSIRPWHQYRVHRGVVAFAGRTIAGGGSSMTLHHLEPGPGSVVDVFSHDVMPALTIEPGDCVVVRSLDAAGHLEPQRTPGEPRPLMLADRRGHALT